MKNKSKFLPVVYVVLGLAALGLHRWVFTACLDERGLVIPNSLPEILFWVLTAAAVAGAFLLTRGCESGEASGFLAGLGELILAAGTASLIWETVKGPAVMVRVYTIFIYITAACLLLSAVMRFLGRKPFFLLAVAPCVLAILQLVECYQLWSEVPQLMEYGPGVGAVLGLALFAYHAMARSADMPFLPLHFAFGLIGIFFCCAAISLGVFVPFFAAAACWMFLELTAGAFGA